MDPLEFVLAIVIIGILVRAGSAVLGPIAGKFAELIGEAAADRRASREGLTRGGGVDTDAIEHLERRLARIEDRLDFLEELKRPASTPQLPGDGSQEH